MSDWNTETRKAINSYSPERARRELADRIIEGRQVLDILSEALGFSGGTAPMMAQSLANRVDPKTANFTRVVIIDESGRVLDRRDCDIGLSYQDDGRTLKVFVKAKE